MTRRPGLWVAAPLLAVALALVAGAQPAFPPLTGAVVDTAGVLDVAARQRLEQLLQAHARQRSSQVVVVVVADLQGYDIESYGYQLGRHWGIGRRGEDNGVLLIVALAERRVRIEVGYGLEGVLTDAVAANIIQAVILPEFRRGRTAVGIEAGTRAILQAIAGEYQTRAASRTVLGNWPLLLLLVVLVASHLLRGPGRRTGRGWIGRGGLGGGFSGGGGGFSGGGGSFGGGGASGRW